MENSLSDQKSKFLTEHFFCSVGFLLTGFIFTITAAALFGFFFKTVVLTITVFFGIWALLFCFRFFRSYKFKFYDRGLVFAFVFALLYSIGIIIFFHDFSLGRDDMGYLVGSQKLVENGSLIWRDPLSRPLHSVRELGLDVFTSQFLPVYSSALAVVMLFGGLKWISLVNAFFWFFGLFALFFLSKRLTGGSSKAGFVCMALTGTLYTSFWFSHRTNSENALFFLFWFAVLLWIKAAEEYSPKGFVQSFFPLSVAILTRGEALIFFVFCLLVTTTVVIRIKRKQQQHNQFQTNEIFRWSALVISVLLLFLVYAIRFQTGYLWDQIISMASVLDIFSQGAVWIGIGLLVIVGILIRKKKVKISQRRIGMGLLILFILFEIGLASLGSFSVIPWSLFRIQYVVETWGWYFIFPSILLIFLGLLTNRFSQSIFFVALLSAPVALLILQPNIALDHPWFMRRFFSILLPMFILLAVVSLWFVMKGRRSLFAIILIAINVIVSLPVIAFEEHKGIQNQLKAISNEFISEDLILMRPGWEWQKWAIPLNVFYGLKIFPNTDLVRFEEFQKIFPALSQQYPNWKTDSSDLIAIQNALSDLEEQEMRRFIKNADRVFVFTDTQSSVHRMFSEENLEYVKTVEIRIPEIKDQAKITGFIREYENSLSLSEIRKRQLLIPPRKQTQERIILFLYRVKNPQNQLDQKFVISSQEKSEEKGSRVILWSDRDLQNFRRWLRTLD